ncbi:MAG: GNAT family N-acetyltransferase [Polyangiaceae bacterium]
MIEPVARADVGELVALVRGVLAEFGLSFGEGAMTDVELLDLPGSYRDRGGELWVARDAGGGLVGCAGLFPVAPATFELRKMYLLPGARGLGLGRALLNTALAWARARRAQRIVLDTTERMARAIAFYEASGFTRDDGEVRGARCSRGYVLRL